jgi:sulfur carrier protein
VNASVQVNGIEQGVAGRRLADVVHDFAVSAGGVAVAVNGTVVPRSRWDDTILAAGDAVEVVTAVQGG